MATATNITPVTRPNRRPTTPAATPLSKAQELMDSYAAMHSKRAAILEESRQKLTPLELAMDDVFEKLQAWAEQHPEELGDKKTLKLEAGTIGFRAGLKGIVFPLDASEDVKAKYLKAVEEEAPNLIKKSVDSKSVANAWDLLPNLRKKLTKLGLEVGQKDVFIVTPKK